jgi:hypothetical protein
MNLKACSSLKSVSMKVLKKKKKKQKYWLEVENDRVRVVRISSHQLLRQRPKQTQSDPRHQESVLTSNPFLAMSIEGIIMLAWHECCNS